MWIKGTFGKHYTFRCKRYDEPSEVFGLNGGCISKLEIIKDGRAVYEYDRGDNSHIQTKETKRVLDYIVTIYN